MGEYVVKEVKNLEEPRITSDKHDEDDAELSDACVS
jgi:hypothetical protein